MSVYGFRFYFTPLAGVLFAFPSRYLFTIGSCLVFSLGSWSTRILTGFHVPRHTQDSASRPADFAYVAFTLFDVPSQKLPLSVDFMPNSTIAVLQPHIKWFGLLPVRSPLLRESLLISIPELLRWFTSLSMTSGTYFIQCFGCIYHYMRITPFGYPGVTGYVLLTLAFRSLSRPSSPYSSQASTINLYSLDHIFTFTFL